MSRFSFPRNKNVLTVVLAILAIPFFSCCVCAPMVAIFIPSKLAEADQLWRDGKKEEAAGIYSERVDRGIGKSDKVALERLVTFYFEQGEKERARHYRRVAIENGTDLVLSPESLQASYEREKNAYEAEKTRIAEQQAQAEFGKAIVKTREPQKQVATTNAEKSADLEGAKEKGQSETDRFRALVEKQIQTEGFSIEINNHALMPPKKVVLVRFNVAENLTDNLTKLGAKSDIIDILKAVDESQINCAEVTVFGSFPLTDEFGNSRNEVVVKASYSGETLERINWSGFLLDNVYEVADSVWFHPAFRD